VRRADFWILFTKIRNCSTANNARRRCPKQLIPRVLSRNFTLIQRAKSYSNTGAIGTSNRGTMDARERHLNTAFDITSAEWDEVLRYQRGCCAICGKQITGKPRPHTDHDHDNGNLRGLLCSQCNRALGKAQDKRWAWTPVCFLKAYLYLIQHPAKLALGRQPVGYPGKIGTGVYRKWAKKKNAGAIRTPNRRAC